MTILLKKSHFVEKVSAKDDELYGDITTKCQKDLQRLKVTHRKQTEKLWDLDDMMNTKTVGDNGFAIEIGRRIGGDSTFGKVLASLFVSLNHQGLDMQYTYANCCYFSHTYEGYLFDKFSHAKGSLIWSLIVWDRFLKFIQTVLGLQYEGQSNYELTEKIKSKNKKIGKKIQKYFNKSKKTKIGNEFWRDFANDIKHNNDQLNDMLDEIMFYRDDEDSVTHYDTAIEAANEKLLEIINACSEFRNGFIDLMDKCIELLIKHKKSNEH